MVKQEFTALRVDNATGRLLDARTIPEGTAITNVWCFRGGRWRFEAVIGNTVATFQTFVDLDVIAEVRQACYEISDKEVEASLLGDIVIDDDCWLVRQEGQDTTYETLDLDF